MRKRGQLFNALLTALRDAQSALLANFALNKKYELLTGVVWCSQNLTSPPTDIILHNPQMTVDLGAVVEKNFSLRISGPRGSRWPPFCHHPGVSLRQSNANDISPPTCFYSVSLCHCESSALSSYFIFCNWKKAEKMKKKCSELNRKSI